jgi:hypothetical protein
MSDDLKLSEAECALFVDLLERERAELPIEMHESRNPVRRNELMQRAEMVRKLLSRMQSPATV